MNRRFHLWEKAALTALCLTLLTASWAQGEREALADSLIRLHVIAVSDDPAEQAVKLRVRDAVLAQLAPVLDGVTAQEEAREKLAADLDGLAQAAASAAGGRQVTVTLGPADYPARRYENGALPAGRYESLRVILGEGEGHNWWGLVFPQLCLPAAQEEPLQEVLAGDGFALLAEEEGVELKFFLLELWDRLLNCLR